MLVCPTLATCWMTFNSHSEHFSYAHLLRHRMASACHKSAQRVAARMGFTGYLALSPQWQPLEVLHAWPLG